MKLKFDIMQSIPFIQSNAFYSKANDQRPEKLNVWKPLMVKDI